MAVFIIQSVRMVVKVSKAVIQQRNIIRTGGKKKHKAHTITLFVICLKLVNDNFLEV